MRNIVTMLLLMTVSLIPTLAQDLPTTITTNDQWTPIERDFDGVLMVLVPAGCFSTTVDDTPYDICFETPFWLDKTEVTQADFARLGGEKAQPNSFEGELLPVETITWHEAQAFCELRGGRLPLELEWEYAARGVDGLLYPWGDEWDETLLQWNWADSERTAEVGSFPAGMSWVGALDMAGNVYEWTDSAFIPYPNQIRSAELADHLSFILRGGSWFETSANGFLTTSRDFHHPTESNNTYGLRCARDYQAE